MVCVPRNATQIWLRSFTFRIHPMFKFLFLSAPLNNASTVVSPRGTGATD